MRFQTGGTSARTNFSFGIEVSDAGSYWKYDLVIIRDTPYKKIILAENLQRQANNLPFIVLSVRYEITNDSDIKSRYDSYKTSGTFYNGGDVLLVFTFSSGRVIQLCFQSDGSGITRVWTRVLIGDTWTKPYRLLVGLP